MTYKDTIKMINDAYSSLRILNNIDRKSYREELYKFERQYEKNHRQYCDDHRQYCDGRQFDFSVDIASKLFVVQHIASALTGIRHDIKSFLYLKQSIFLAESLVLNYEDKIKEALKDFDLNKLCSLYYTLLTEKKVA